jgi:hypothetical protein
VYFNQEVGGYPMVGAAKLFNVIVNPYGTILSAGFYNPELQYAGEVDCITVREAYDLFLDGEALDFIFSPGFKKVEVNDVYIGYYIESQTELQEYFMPVYVFEGELSTSSGNPERFRLMSRLLIMIGERITIDRYKNSMPLWFPINQDSPLKTVMLNS